MLYEFRCPECGREKEVSLPIAERNNPQYCICGAQLDRRLSLPAPPIVTIGGREKVLNTLNRESGGYTYPGGEKHGARYDQAMAKGLEKNGQPGKYGSGVPISSA